MTEQTTDAGLAPSGGSSRLGALRIRNYRLIWFGLGVSQAGRQVTTVAQALLVYELTDSAVALGVLTALQFLPLLVLGAFTGLIADRRDKRLMLRNVEVVAALNAFGLMGIALLDSPPLWPIYALALISGVCNSFEDPARRALPMEIVPPGLIQNAVSLTAGMNTVAQMSGPALAALLSSTVGYAWCFAVDGCSYLAVVAATMLMDPSKMHRRIPLPSRPGQIREGIRYVRRTHELLVPLVVMAFVGALAVNHNITMPVLIKEDFGHPSKAYALLMSTLSAGSFVGAVLLAGRRSAIKVDQIARTALIMGLTMTAMAVNPWFPAAFVAAACIGFASSQFTTTSTAIVQMFSDQAMRGRVLSLQMITFLGVTPIGGPIVGLVTERYGPRSGLALGAAACFGSGAWAFVYCRRAAARTTGAIAVLDPS